MISADDETAPAQLVEPELLERMDVDAAELDAGRESPSS